MSAQIEFEEEEFEGSLNAGTLRRLFGLLNNYKVWTVGFLAAVLTTSFLDSLFTFYSKRIIDEGIVARDWDHLITLVTQ